MKDIVRFLPISVFAMVILATASIALAQKPLVREPKSPQPKNQAALIELSERIKELNRKIDESEARAREYSDRALNYATLTVKFVGVIGTLVGLMLAAAAAIGFIGLRGIREEAREATRLRSEIEHQFASLRSGFESFYRRINFPKLFYERAHLDPLDQERFKEFDIQVLFGEVIGIRIDAEVYEALGLFWRNLEIYERAIVRFDKALEKEPSRIDSIFQKGICLGFLAEKEENTEKQSTLRAESLALIERVLATNKESPRYNFAKGWILDEMNRFEEALAAYEEARRRDPQNPKIIYNIACSYARSGNFQRALEELAKIRENKYYMEHARKDKDFDLLSRNPIYGPNFLKIINSTKVDA